MSTPDLVYKLPRPFMDSMGAVLTVVDWSTSSTARLTLPDGTEAILEAVKGRRGETIIRPATPGSALRIRKLADAIAAAQPDKYPRPDPTEIERVLTLRNPTPDKQD